ncbi:helix-turn-helix domain-containing protein [Limosilactobacillus reuteri]|uniref:HTH cro/C1-type domain-containing protein n=1 Tax=Limosilactobacillus reuteri TD1 TaxID=1358027 RepID=S5NDB5_LIMRT|nr:helix-turn-helix transcriptional regulator [Limosilactobacillus reuteri]AGR65013.1 hypothetical protein N134_02365 [Limosilactobacillus reuteri TD1]MCC4324627.1 helix-turn-helix transcriptional regulator [Limosilactobacillus reuteri]MCC4331938.1 helix-turn-helix transcriptional regulator [Limosilactobacillus reuteri]MCC4332974.1 helix-turn-helix transcriptional regulator [Limosilactobacillus reuteri]MCC4353938.1 helix-turn-helix transcriptional regulator [Limosilactobacillus reuteri]
MNRIKEIRKKKKLTLQQVSNETGISVSSLSAYEKEKNEKGYRAPKLDKLLTLANFFDVPLVSLFEMDTAKVESQLINSAFSKWYGVSHWGVDNLKQDEKKLILHTASEAKLSLASLVPTDSYSEKEKIASLNLIKAFGKFFEELDLINTKIAEKKAVDVDQSLSIEKLTQLINSFSKSLSNAKDKGMQ